MKDRDYKSFCTGNIYHIFNRGNNKNNIFVEEDDYKGFLKRLKVCLGLEESRYLNIKPFHKSSFNILAYCLMPNHYHFLIEQCSVVPIGLLIKKLCTSYGMYFNRKHDKVGNLFQDIFKAKIIENDAHLCQVSAYIHNNPEVTNPYEYQFSSIQEYLRGKGEVCQIKKILGLFDNDINQYKKFMESQRQRKDHPFLEHQF